MGDSESLGPTGRFVKAIGPGLAGATAVFTVLGVAEGTLPRVQRSSPTLFLVAFAVLIAGIVFGWAVGHVRRPVDMRAWLSLLAVIIYVGGLLWLSQLVIQASAMQDRPQIDVALTAADGSLDIEGTVRAIGLKGDEHLLVRVYGEPSGPAELVFAARVGADHRGEVEHAYSAPIASGAYRRVLVVASVCNRDNETREEKRCDARPELADDLKNDAGVAMSRFSFLRP